MKQDNRILATLAAAVLLSGCDGIFSIDNWDPPSSNLTGQLHFNGKPVGVRANSAQLELWQIEPAYPIEQKIVVHVDQNGQYSTVIFDGTYEVNVLSGSGGWVNNPTRRQVVVQGNTVLDIPVQPYYTIENESITYNPNPAPGGSITATFNVGQHVTSPLVEYVGVYIGNTAIVDRTNKLAIANNVVERTRAQVQNQLNTNSPITITVNLPADIHVTPSPERRNHLHVRIGVKTVGVAEILFSDMYKIAI